MNDQRLRELILNEKVLSMGTARIHTTKIVQRIKILGVEVTAHDVRKELALMLEDGVVTYAEHGVPRWGRAHSKTMTRTSGLTWTIRENKALRRWELMDDDFVYSFADTREELLTFTADLSEKWTDDADVDRAEAERLMQSVGELEATAKALLTLVEAS